jgi:hypothetical protein
VAVPVNWLTQYSVRSTYAVSEAVPVLPYAPTYVRYPKLGAEVIETVVLSSNEDGLRFAQKDGFVETERYLLPGDTIPWIDLRLS